MASPEDRIKELGLTLPPAPKPLGAYVPIVRAGNLLFLSGILPLKDGELKRKGKVGAELTLDEAREEARIVVLNALAALKAELGALSKVKSCVKLNGYIASASGFTDQPKVLNSASELIFDIFGESGRHARAAVGVLVLPMDAPLEIDFVFEAENRL